QLLPSPAPWSQAPPERAAIQDYLDALLKQLAELNGERTDEERGPVVALQAKVVADSSLPNRAYAPKGRPWREAVHHIRRELRQLANGVTAADDAYTAGSRRGAGIIPNVVRELERHAEPLLLMSDPGEGKSTTLRSVAIAVARAERKRPEPRLV